jgi:hypothetical protein
VRFNVMWRRAFGHDWPYAADRAIHPWLQTAYDAQMQFYGEWRLPAGTLAVNWWNMTVASTVADNYPGGRDIIGPVKDRVNLADNVFIPNANRTWWEQQRQEVEAFVPPTCLAVSCLLGRSAIAPDWARSAVGSIVLVDDEHNSFLPSLYTALRGVIAFVGAKASSQGRTEGIVDSLVYTVYLLDGFDWPIDFQFARYVVDRTADKGFLANWRRAHGRVWPEPQEALPPLVKAMLAQYMQIVNTAWDTVGQAVDARFDDLLVQHTGRLATMGVTYNDLDDLNRRASRRRVQEKAASPSQAARGPTHETPEPVVETQVSEIDKQIAEVNRELSKRRDEKRGMVAALVQPAAPQRARTEHALPVEPVTNKAHRKRTKQGQLAAAAASKAAEQTQEQDRAFLKETASAFREGIATVAAEPSAEHLEREAARARHAQVAGDRRVAKAAVREDAERRVAEAFGL